jgi:hypothetical protein
MEPKRINLLRSARPEALLLLNCTRVVASPVHQAQITALLQQKIDWTHLLELARRNCVLPLLYLNLQPVTTGLIPAAFLAILARAYQRTAFDNLFLTQQLIDLHKVLTGARIPVIAYKGSALTQAVYGNLALRQFGDLDLIVRHEDIGKARELLLAQGFCQRWPEHNLSPQQEATHIQQKYNYTFHRAQDDLVVELHWGIAPRYLRVPWHAEWLWQRLDRISLAGQSIATFCPEELLLALSVHGANHCWNRLHWVCDIAELLRRFADLNWSHVLNLAQTWRVQRMLHLGLVLAHSLLDADLPAAVLGEIAEDKGALGLASQSCRWLFANKWLGFRPFEEPLYHLRMREHWQDRGYYCAQMLVPSAADRAFIALPQSMSFLYYPLRPVQLITKHGLHLFKKL